MRSLQASAVLVAGLLAFGAQAQTTAPAAGATATPPAEMAASSFKRVDADQNGKLSREEAARLPAIADKFDALDKDKDGSLSSEEFAAGYQPSK
jgi:hypothetical protein